MVGWIFAVIMVKQFWPWNGCHRCWTNSTLLSVQCRSSVIFTLKNFLKIACFHEFFSPLALTPSTCYGLLDFSVLQLDLLLLVLFFAAFAQPAAIKWPFCGLQCS